MWHIFFFRPLFVAPNSDLKIIYLNECMSSNISPQFDNTWSYFSLKIPPRTKSNTFVIKQ